MLSDLVVMAFSVLNHKYWPYVDLTQEKPDYLALDVYGANEMSLIIENYNNFFPDVSGKHWQNLPSRFMTSGRPLGV